MSDAPVVIVGAMPAGSLSVTVGARRVEVRTDMSPEERVRAEAEARALLLEAVKAIVLDGLSNRGSADAG